MNLRSILGHAGSLAVAGLAAAVVLGAVFGQPLLVSFVETGSMQPALDPGDGFVVLPRAIAGPVGTGDVVVYRAEHLQGGGLITHRVVGTTDRGYVTRGDANAVTDQASGEPPVKESQVTGVVVQYDGRVLSIPGLGAAVNAISAGLGTVQFGLARLLGTGAVLGSQGLAYLLFGASLAWYAVGAWRRRNAKSKVRETRRETGRSARFVLVGFVTLVVVAATVGMAGPAGPEKFQVISAHYDSDSARVIPAGESESTTYPMGNGGVVPVYVVLEPQSEAIDVSPREHRIAGGTTANATVTLSAPPETGAYRRYLVEHRYFALLPRPVLAWLYEFHPWAPIVAIDGLLGAAFYLFGVALLGTGRLRVRSRSRDLPLEARLRRLLRRLYS